MLPAKQGLYNPDFEHDNCGAGFICSLKGIKTNDIIHKALDILDKLKSKGKELFLITNAHRITLNIKLKKFDISKYFSEMVCSHELGYVKEDIQFWHILRLKLKLDYKYSVLVEDTFDNINSAYHAGLNNFVYISDNKKFTSPLSPLIVKSFSELSSSI